MDLKVIKGTQLIKKDGSTVAAEKVFADHKVICFYFSAHWCPPCRGFTPILKDFYEEISDEGDVTIIFISSDRSAADMDEYFRNDHGDYFCMPHGSEASGALKKAFNISGIPSLIVVRSDGTLITDSGRNDVSNGSPKATCTKWIAS